jgi:hypothetical protein
MTKNFIQREQIKGFRNLNNCFLSFFLFFSGISFFLIGFFSYFNFQIFPFFNIENINYIPQGILMIFYGTMGIIFSIYFIFNIIFDVGSGYNEYSKKEEIIRLIRKGYPGKNSLIFLTYSLDSIKKIKISYRQGFDSRNNIFLVLRDKREIPLYPSQNFLNIYKIEENGILLSQFLDIPLENETKF